MGLKAKLHYLKIIKSKTQTLKMFFDQAQVQPINESEGR